MEGGFMNLFIGQHIWSSCDRPYAVLLLGNSDEQNNLSFLEVRYIVAEEKKQRNR